MALPIVAIVGRPNVGKSSLFNWLAGRRISIVDPMAGVTRDRVTTVVAAGDRYFELTDTGGIGIVDVDDLTADVERQIQTAIDTAAVVVFVVDARDGLVPLDIEVADRLRSLNKPVILVANKADTEKIGQQTGEFFKLGYGEPLRVSAEQKLGKAELLEAIVRRLPSPGGEQPPGEVALKIAVVGRRNAGKSTFINSLAEADRVIVSEVPGTTRDSIDVRFERDGKTFLAIDTAGVRKATSLASSVEYYSLHRAQRSIRRADVVMHFMDARHRIGRVDKQLAEYILAEYKPAVFVVNKWDLVKHATTTDRMAEYVRKVFPMLDHVPIAFITAKSGKNVLRLLQLAVQLHKQDGIRVSTGDLNRVIRAAVEANSPPLSGNRQPKIYYATQVGVHPPTIVLFTNGPELFEETYLRYLTRCLRDAFPFSEVAIKLLLRARSDAGAGREEAATGDSSLSDDSRTDPPEILRQHQAARSQQQPPQQYPPQQQPAQQQPARLPEEDRAPARPRRRQPDADTWDF
jgi:GTP-binding protein